MSIGGKLKELRILKGLTQEELADRAELSKGFISQVERDLTSPSIATLMDILQCLGTTIGEFFNEAPEEQIVFEKNDYFIKEDPELKNEIQWIIPNAQKNTMEPIRLTLSAGGSTYPDSPHEGDLNILFQYITHFYSKVNCFIHKLRVIILIFKVQAIDIFTNVRRFLMIQSLPKK